ncbi:hypothetical protein JCM5350_000028 [Sporobolomyces pararoseus]
MPTLTDLPPELLLSVLLEPQLDYKDLKCISRVCKTLHGIEQDSKLDVKLFRKGLPPREGDEEKDKIVGVKAGATVKLHPMLKYVDLMPFSIDQLQPMFGRGRYKPSKSSKMIDLPCMNEYATSPPSRRIIWKGLGPEAILETTSETGVAIKEVLTDHVEYWNEIIEGEDRDEFLETLRATLDEMAGEEEDEEAEEFFDYLKEQFSLLEEGELLTRRQTNISSTVMTGVQQVKALGGHSVEFLARWEGGCC